MLLLRIIAIGLRRFDFVLDSGGPLSASSLYGRCSAHSSGTLCTRKAAAGQIGRLLERRPTDVGTGTIGVLRRLRRFQFACARGPRAVDRASGSHDRRSATMSRQACCRRGGSRLRSASMEHVALRVAAAEAIGLGAQRQSRLNRPRVVATTECGEGFARRRSVSRLIIALVPVPAPARFTVSICRFCAACCRRGERHHRVHVVEGVVPVVDSRLPSFGETAQSVADVVAEQ